MLQVWTSAHFTSRIRAIVMVLAVFLLATGILLAGYGLRTALSRPRPVDLAGALLSAVGAAMAIVGAARILSTRFFG